ncbi:META domain-containing protein [Sphingopyxis sp. RIFCSPHIGHO2_12_FULL_65_19]|uniref:META domain-containing protein n=1 Tax=Sphingopyxis sp. RIFCSPHIGHO2_12_FULL_65_19 TaxID=1802172 RepID=UPI0008C7F85F|nr:META domain-containing protein [Sphingopyxis sp. RIFCSPHIGHO2_12_FULL_65_19]OHD09542.1 MAG: META domain-containing protein [Sphingopyxis sp. RIFCSPHIGHO2_12_FULL_65_19]
MIRYLPLLALAACAPATESPPQSPGAPPAAYMALGTEPGWTLEITPSRLSYDGDYGETKIMVPNPGARAVTNGEHYVTDRLKVEIARGECSDGMSDRRYADTVTVVADGKTVKGCGGKILPPADIAGTSWTFVSIGGKPVAPDRPTSLQFDGVRLSGSAGCNRFSGSYSVADGTLAAGPLVATKMACPGAGMAQESAFFVLMRGPVSLSFPTDGTLILTGSEGQTAVLKRVI